MAQLEALTNLRAYRGRISDTDLKTSISVLWMISIG